MLLNALYALGKMPEKDEENYMRCRIIGENIVAAISQIACTLKEPKVTEFSLSILSRRLGAPVSPLDPYILMNLVDLALAAPVHLFSEISRIFAHIGKQKTSAKTTMLTTAALDGLLALSRRIHTRPDLHGPYLISLLNLITEKGVSIQQLVQENGRNSQLSTFAAELGAFLPILYHLLNHDNFDESLLQEQETVALMRNVWFHAVHFGFCHETTWLKEWGYALKGIAMKTPLLVPPGAAAYLDQEVEFNPVLRSGSSDAVMNSMRTRLNAILPEYASALRHLSFAHHTLLLAVYYMEIFRAQSGDCSHVFKYFEIPGVNSNKLAPFLQVIAEKVLDEFIETQLAKPEPIDAKAMHEMRQLMIGSCHGIENAHTRYLKGADRLAARFPMLFANSSLVSLALELVQLLWLSCESDALDEVRR
jgi:phosphatidylinositol 4-kinase